MLTRLRLKNLKTWGEQLWDDGVALAPVTLLLGPNSAGKTSLLQLPLLLKQTLESPEPTRDLNLGGQVADLLDLGPYASVIHGHETDRELGLGLTLQDDDAAPAATVIDYQATFRLDGDEPALQRLALTGAGRTFAATRQGDGAFRLEAPDDPSQPESRRLRADVAFHPECSVAFSPDAVAALGPLGPEVQDLSRRVRRLAGQVAYLGPFRQPPERRYRWTGCAPADLGKHGERAVQALLADDHVGQPRQDGQEGGRHWLLQQVSAWMARLGIADELCLQPTGPSGDHEVIVVRGRQRSNLADVGFGVSQVLPFLVLAYAVPPGATVIAEQPEIHLHPRAQAGLADLMAEVATQRRVQFLVETHSEHLFRRLQSLIAAETLAPAACRLYFVDRQGDGETALLPLELDAYGRVAHWPQHFFGDVVGETERQLRSRLRRLARHREGAPE
jgi:hypothetical protein